MFLFSRDYIEIGTYLNQIFSFMGIRLVALGGWGVSGTRGVPLIEYMWLREVAMWI